MDNRPYARKDDLVKKKVVPQATYDKHEPISRASPFEASMHAFDVWVVSALNHGVHWSWTLDTTLLFLSQSDLLKGGVAVTLLWWACFQPPEGKAEGHPIFVSTLLGCFLAVAVAFLLELVLPFRPRPLHDAGLHLLLPYGLDPKAFNHWTSFPSDHAVLFSALVAGITRASPRLGLVASLHTALLVLAPRLYLGLHYPSDLLAGVLLGGAMGWIVTAPALRAWLTPWTAAGQRRSPGLYYALLFLVSLQVAMLFGDLRDLASFGYHVERAIAAHYSSRPHPAGGPSDIGPPP